MTEQISLVVNGARRDIGVEPRRLLVQVLREDLGLTGTHVGCDTSQCGACTVHLDGEAVKSCTVLAVQADGGDVKTIEGMANGEDLHPLQAAFWEKHGLQCGFCTPGMIMVGGRPHRAEPRPERAGDPARASKATSAAARATRTSSPRSRLLPARCGPDRRPHVVLSKLIRGG